MNKNKYIGLSIGPISLIMDLATRCRGLWSASYFFSHLMKEILTELNKEKGKKQFAVWLPMLDTSNEKISAGIYPDRLLVQVLENGNREEFINCIGSAINKIASHPSDFGFKVNEKEQLKNWLVDVLNLAITDVFELEINENAVFENNKRLDVLEQAVLPIITEKSLNPLNKLFGGNNNYLTKDGISDSNDFRYPSLIEIATEEFKRKSERNFKEAVKNSFFKVDITKEEDAIESFIKEVKRIDKKAWRQDHQYVAIITSDGDSIGKTIEKVGSSLDDTNKFSRFLVDFGKQSAEKIIKFGGQPIYVGGDDLLFVSPITMPDNTNSTVRHSFLSLISDIDEIFSKAYQKAFPDIAVQQPTLSWGVSIFYYKYPLNQALSSSYDMLFELVKKKTDKNSIGIQYIRHSGQTIQSVIDKNVGNWQTDYKDLIRIDKKELNQDFINSLQYKLGELHPLFLALNKADKGNVKQRWTHFFDQNIKKGASDKLKPYLDDTRDLVVNAYANYDREFQVVNSSNSKFNHAAFQNIYTALKLQQFFQN